MRTGWDTITDKGSGGGGSTDPNVINLKDATRIRLLEDGGVRWRQHYITSATDPEQGRSVVCPRGPDGRLDALCPCCMKPVDADNKQRFSVSRRFAANVWDYDSEGVKVLIAGPQVFDEFKAATQVGLNPTSTDYLITKMGEGLQTKYKVIRGQDDPLPVQLSPDDMHDLDKYDTPSSAERIFEVMEEMSIDYDSLETPSFTLDQAESFQMPYGKSKGSTIAQLVQNDRDYALYMHNVKKEVGLGDPVFVALQTVLEDRGVVASVDGIEAKAPPKPAKAASNGHAEAPADLVTLLDSSGVEAQVPSVAKDALLKAGYTEPQATEAPSEPTEVTLVGPDGSEVQVPIAAAEALRKAGFQDKGADTPADTTPAFVLPGDDEQVEVKVSAVPVPLKMTFVEGKHIINSGQGQFVDEQLAAAYAQADKDEDKDVAQQAAVAAETPDPANTTDLSPDLTVKTDDGQWTHPALGGESKKTKGAVTQALNRLAKDSGKEAAAPVSQPDSPKGVKLDEAKTLLAGMGELQGDFKKLIALFQEVAGKNQIMDFTEDELDTLITKLQAMKASA